MLKLGIWPATGRAAAAQPPKSRALAPTRSRRTAGARQARRRLPCVTSQTVLDNEPLMNELARGIDELARMLRGADVARGVVVWAHCRHALEVVSAWGANQADYNLALDVWQRDRPDLQDGRCVSYDETDFVPLLNAHRDLVGVLELAQRGSERPGQRAFLDVMTEELGRQLSVPLPKAMPELLTIPLARLASEDGVDHFMRRMHEALLDRVGWNIKRLADELGLPRQTLQNRLRKLGVRRVEQSSKERRKRGTSSADVEPALRAALWPRLSARATRS